MQIAYRKMHGTGNVILVVDQRKDKNEPPSRSKLRELGDSATGPGFDQLLWLRESNSPGCLAQYRVFNADGSEVEQCGNGVRCVARFLTANADEPRTLSLQSPAGRIDARVESDGTVAVSMGSPIFAPTIIPFVAQDSAATYTLEVAGTTLTVRALSMGNPHCVLPVDDVGTARVAELGALIERHARFPERCNVGFMQTLDRRSIALRVFERGVGETRACGTGACAAVVSGIRLGELDADVRVALPGGEVMVSWRGDGEPVWLTGNAETISDGMMEL